MAESKERSGERTPLAQRVFGGTPTLLAREDLKRHAGAATALGVVVMLLGVVMLVYEGLATELTVFFVGGVLCLAGLVQILLAFVSRRWNWFFLYLLAGVVGVVAGVSLMSNPMGAAMVLTAVIATYLFVAGLFRMLMAVALTPPSWGLMLVGGGVELLLGFLLWAQWPASGLWAIGLFVGVDLLCVGAAYTATAYRALSIEHRTERLA